MKLIAAVDKKWAIGNAGKLLVSIPEDMKFFREETMGKVVVMGRKTLESLKDKSGLFGRINIVLTSNKNYKAKDAIVCNSVEEVLEAVSAYDTDDVYVIGGGMVYEQFLDKCNEAHITKIDYVYQADTHFPNLDENEEWQITATSDEKTYFDLCYEFVRYSRR